jgi:hypothetical protein
MANGSAPPTWNLQRVPIYSPRWVICCGILFSMILFVLMKKPQRRRVIGFAPMVALMMLVAGFVNGCGVTASNSAPAVVVGTAAGVYPLVITATGGGNVTATTTVTLTVN